MLIRLNDAERADCRCALLWAAAKISPVEQDVGARMMALWARLNAPAAASEKIELDACERGDLREALHMRQQDVSGEVVARLRDLFRKLTYAEAYCADEDGYFVDEEDLEDEEEDETVLVTTDEVGHA